MKRIFIDMDGVLTEYRENCTEADLMKKGYFSSLKPESEMLGALEMLDKCSDSLGISVCVLTKAYPSTFRYSISEKYEWRDEYMPYLYDSQFIVVNGEKQEKSDAIRDLLDVEIDKDCFLIDDYNHNLSDWSARGGTAIKFVNAVNDKSKSFVGSRISYNMSAFEIFNQIISIINPEKAPILVA